MSSLGRVLIAKASRVFVFGITSVMTPVYLSILGYSPLLVGAAVALMIAGSAISNLILVRYEKRLGRRRFLTVFSLLMFASGVLFFLSTSYAVILFACLIGNISTTGTEAGPFQSVEAGALPNLVSPERVNRSFGIYNMIGYSASSIGAFTASAPYYFHSSLIAFQALYMLYGMVGLVLVVLYRSMPGLEAQGRKPAEVAEGVSKPARRDIAKLSALFSIDAFGGGFVSQSLLVLWFYIVYKVSLNDLGIIFLVVNVITALSTLGASYLADKIGNLRTMVYTHLLSNVCLVLIPFAGSLVGALILLFARQSVSQMDVPTRQAFMVGIFNEEERVPAYATTNIARIISSVPGAPSSGALIGVGLASAPLLIAGSSKILYDVLIFGVYRKRAK